MRIRTIIRPMLTFVILLLQSPFVYAQDVKRLIEKSQVLIDNGKYKKAYKTLIGINEEQVNEYGDTCLMLFVYKKGTCLYYMEKYKDAIPYFQRSLKYMEKQHHEDCDYLEMLYGIGACYKKIGDYPKAEEYFRRTIMKGNYFNLNCAIRNQTYSEMAGLYSLMGKPEFADICTSRIESEMRVKNTKNLDAQLDALWDMYKAHENMGKVDECLSDLKKMRHLVEDNKGKINIDYLEYSYIMGTNLRYSYERPQEAASVHKEMIEIGKQFRTHQYIVLSAYLDYLRYLSENNKVDSIENILPAAIKYYNETEDKREENVNIYELVGNGLCDAKNFDEGVKYLEKIWNGKTAQSIKALDYLTYYYFVLKNNSEKALSYAKRSEEIVKSGHEVTESTKINILQYLVEINQRLGNNQEANRYSKIIEPLILNTGDIQKYLRYLIYWSRECANSGNNEKCAELINKINELMNKISIDDKIIAYNQMAFVCIKTNKYDEAIDYATKGIDFTKEGKGEDSMAIESLYHNLGRAYMLKGVYTEALTALNKSKELQLKRKGEVMQRTADYIKECESK